MRADFTKCETRELIGFYKDGKYNNDFVPKLLQHVSGAGVGQRSQRQKDAVKGFVNALGVGAFVAVNVEDGRTKISAMVQVCAAGIAAQSALPGALQHAEEWRVGGCGRAQGQGLGRRHAGSPAALPTWPPMVAKCSGAMVLHLMAIRGAPSSPRAEI